MTLNSIDPIDASLAQRAIVTSKGPLVLLFYDGFEWQLRKGFAGQAYAQARRLARFLYRTLRRKQVRTGFYTAFVALRGSLEKIGCDVRVNDYRMAERYPHYPVGLAGYPTVLGKAPRSNPIIFGPGDFGMPEESRSLAQNDQYRILIQPSEWFCDLYRPFCGDKLLSWYAGIDTQAWPDASREPKTTDCLIYDKIRWDREDMTSRLLQPMLDDLKRKGRSYEILRYGEHAQFEFSAALKRSRSLIFVCEHETQGLAYQEAMAANVPVLAWDEGRLIDPWLAPYAKPGLQVSSVPYFSDECGMTFRIGEFEQRFDQFWSRLPDFLPRSYVGRELNMKSSAEAYLNAYLSISDR
ncbi:MAG: glycosyltransferase family 1 protein [Hyphomicrobiales bacterium]|nr:glycosyltransferase family 1 protein [Hyphomicrobiales bacterium]